MWNQINIVVDVISQRIEKNWNDLNRVHLILDTDKLLYYKRRYEMSQQK